MDITGRLTADAQIRSVQNGKQVVNFSVAVNDSYRNKQGERVTLTEYFDCSYWISTAVAEYLTKGRIVELTGRVSARAWLSHEGEAKASLNFNTSKITLHGGASVNEKHVKSVKNNPLKAKSAVTEGDDLPF